VPAGGERTGLGLAVAHHHQRDQVGAVEDRSIGVREAVAELATLVEAARRLGRSMATDAAGEGELLEEPPHSRGVLALVRIDLRVRPLQVRLRQNSRRAMPGARDEDRIQIVFVDQPIEVRIGERLAGVRPPMTEQPRLGVRELQRFSEQRIVLEVEHSQAEVQTRSPVCVHPSQLVRFERSSLDGRTRRAVCRDRGVGVSGVGRRRKIGSHARVPHKDDWFVAFRPVADSVKRVDARVGARGAA